MVKKCPEIWGSRAEGLFHYLAVCMIRDSQIATFRVRSRYHLCQWCGELQTMSKVHWMLMKYEFMVGVLFR
jgi:hypothetical protein